jgi:hypothetical protein
MHSVLKLSVRPLTACQIALCVCGQCLARGANASGARPQAPQEPFAPLPSAADAGGVKASAIMTRSLSTPATATVADYDRLTSGSALPADCCPT